MPRANCTFSKNDLRRAVEAVSRTGLAIIRVDFTPDGQITVHTSGTPVEQDPNPALAERFGRRKRVAEDTQSASPSA